MLYKTDILGCIYAIRCNHLLLICSFLSKENRPSINCIIFFDIMASEYI